MDAILQDSSLLGASIPAEECLPRRDARDWAALATAALDWAALAVAVLAFVAAGIAVWLG